MTVAAFALELASKQGLRVFNVYTEICTECEKILDKLTRRK
jgi:hypothetical protein